MTTLKDLMTKRTSLQRQLAGFGKIIHGTVLTMKRSCGKKGCRCQRGDKHTSLYLVQRRNGKTAQVYIPPAANDELLKWVDNYRQLLYLIDQLSEINLAILRLRKKHRG